MRVGERISNRYKLIKEIGAGGVAKVFLAEDLILERQVAVKLMAYNFHNDEASIRRFKREALSTTELLHPNIVDVVDVGEDDIPYIVMEYVDGYDLKEYIKHHQPIPYKQTVNIMTQILNGVEYAHEHNIIHRDLKPQNILIDHNDTVKITDFGIAVALSENSITQTNSLLGSVHYISPEQARGSMATKQSDIYSLGILLFELLSGRVPFDGESAVSIALKHFQNDMPSLREMHASLPQALENVVLRATAKEPAHRYQTVHEMKHDMNAALLPSRSNEEKFVPADIDDDRTRVITPIAAPVTVNKTEEKPDTNTAEIKENANRTLSAKSNKRKKVLLSIIALLVISVFGILLFILTQPREVQVPNLQGMTVEEAQVELEDLNLMVGEIIELNNEEIEANQIIRTNPNAESVLRESGEVDFYVSLGKTPVTLGDYEEGSYEEIRAELTELGFTVERNNANDDSIPEGYIISQNIEAGEEVIPSETTIALTVSEGPAGYSLSNLTGYSSEGVDRYADDYNLSVTITREPHDTVPEGQVARQSPEPGSIVYNGSRISVVFSTGPEEPQFISFDKGIIINYVDLEEDADEEDGQSEEGNADENEDEETNSDEETEPVEAVRQPNKIEIYVNDAENTYDDIYREFDIYEDTPEIISFNVEAGNTASYRVVRNGEIIMEESDISPND